MTAQATDSLRFDGLDWQVLAEPLDEHLAELPIRLVAPHTALWRGYLASWEVVDGRLLLAGLRVWVAHDVRHAVERQVLSLDGRSLPHHADYLSGSLPIASGKQVQHVHRGFESRYELEDVLEVRAGMVTAPRRRRRMWLQRPPVAEPHRFTSIELVPLPEPEPEPKPVSEPVTESAPVPFDLLPSCEGPCGGEGTMGKCSVCEQWVHLRCFETHRCLASS